MLVHVVRLHVHGLYSRSVLMPGFHFDFGFAIPVPSSDVVGAAHLIALGVAALGLAVGVRSRACAFAFALLYGWFVLCERTMFNNHFYLYTLLAILLSLVEAQQQFTLRPRAGRAGDRCRSWERAALRAQLCIVRAHTRCRFSARQCAETTAVRAAAHAGVHVCGHRQAQLRLAPPRRADGEQACGREHAPPRECERAALPT